MSITKHGLGTPANGPISIAVARLKVGCTPNLELAFQTGQGHPARRRAVLSNLTTNCGGKYTITYFA